jgi:hypothetical protein
MSFRLRRSIKQLPGVHLPMRKRGVSPSIEVRGTNVFGYTHMEKSRIIGFIAPVSTPSLASRALLSRDWRGLLWIGLLVIAIAAAAAQTMI